MRTLKTHFEQVPIEIVRTMLKQQSEPDAPAGETPAVNEQEPEENLFEAIGYPSKG
jgi:hypothetical protein